VIVEHLYTDVYSPSFVWLWITVRNSMQQPYDRPI